VKERNTKAAGLLLLTALTGCVGQGVYDQMMKETLGLA